MLPLLCAEPIRVLGPDLTPNRPSVMAIPAPTPRPNIWGEMVAEIRISQGVSQRQLAAKAGVNRSTLRRIEDGDTDGDISILERLFRFLGYELEAISCEGVRERHRRQLAAAQNADEASKIAARALLDLTV